MVPRMASKILVSGISSIKAESTREMCKGFVKSRISDESESSFLPNTLNFENLNLADPTYCSSSPLSSPD